MNFRIFGNDGAPVLMLIPGLGVSYEIFLPLARQVTEYIKEYNCESICCAYGLSLGGKILSRVLERNEVTIEHSILDAAPLLPLPRWLVGPLRYLQACNVWSCYHWTEFWRLVFRSHYFDVLLNECRKVFPYGGMKAVLKGYKSVYTNRLESIPEINMQFWYGTKEAVVAKAQVKHLKGLCPDAQIMVFKKMNHGQLLIDRPEEVANLIENICKVTS